MTWRCYGLNWRQAYQAVTAELWISLLISKSIWTINNKEGRWNFCSSAKKMVRVLLTLRPLAYFMLKNISCFWSMFLVVFDRCSFRLNSTLNFLNPQNCSWLGVNFRALVCCFYLSWMLFELQPSCRFAAYDFLSWRMFAVLYQFSTNSVLTFIF